MQDELDAANKVVKSNKEIRQVLIDYTLSPAGNSVKKLFGNGEVVRVTESNIYQDLGHEGSALVMNIEMNKEMQNAPTTTKKGQNADKKNSKSGDGKQKKKK
jgi:hypothetical protein